MLAVAAQWRDTSKGAASELAARLANLLCAGIGGKADEFAEANWAFAFRPLSSKAARVGQARPAELSDGRLCQFHGYFDNVEEIRAELGLTGDDLNRLYGVAVERWGDRADLRIVGEYASVIVDPHCDIIRLARSPLRAPPLEYANNGDLVAVASVSRAIFAAGVPKVLNEDRMADSALVNFADEEAAWFDGLRRVPLGSTVELRPGQERKLKRYYDIFSFPEIRLDSDEEDIARTKALLDEAVEVAMRGSTLPGCTLSSGLDSPQVAIRAQTHIREGRKLPTFTFHPEPGWDGLVVGGMNGDERPMVEEFAAMHPRLETHIVDNAGIGHDYRWNDMFLAMDAAPSGMCNVYCLHGIYAAARARGCDLLLFSEWGNYTFSDKGEWAFVEYLLKGRWRQLVMALSKHPNDPRGMLRKFIALCLVPLLPDYLWRLMKRVWHRGEQLHVDMITPLSKSYRESSGAERRRARARLNFERYQPWNRKHALNLLMKNHHYGSDEVAQAFEQLYGVRQRDPMAYRPFVEFCLGLPTELFVRDGTLRWLAKQLAQDIMPKRQHDNLLNGRWDADWHLRIRRKRSEYLEEFDRIACDEKLSSMLDIHRLRRALKDFPEQTSLDPQVFFPLEFAIPRAMLTARFYRYATGRNAG